MSLSFGFADDFLMIRQGLGLLGNKTREMKCPSHNLISRGTFREHDLSPVKLT